MVSSLCFEESPRGMDEADANSPGRRGVLEIDLSSPNSAFLKPEREFECEHSYDHAKVA